MLRALLAALVIATAAFSWPAYGQAVLNLPVKCYPTAFAHGVAKDKFGETPAGRGMTEGGALGELMLAPDGSWSWFALMPNGLTCIIASGSDWQELVIEPVGDPS